MTYETPLSPRPLGHLSTAQRRVLTTAELRAHGVTAAEAEERARPGGPWQRVLPGVYLLHPGPPTAQERLHAVLLYAARAPLAAPAPGVPAQPDAGGPRPSPARPDAMVTGLAALTLHGFGCTPPLTALEKIDVLVPRLRRLRSTGCARVIRTPVMPAPRRVTGLPVAPVARALTDAVASLTDAAAVRCLMTEAVRGGHCEPAAVVRELSQAKLLGRPHVVDAVDSILAERRALAEDRLYRMVREHGLPEPLWNVDLRLPGGPYLGGLDAYWPDQAVAVEVDTRGPRHGLRPEEDVLSERYDRKREHLERLGITVVRVTPRMLRDASGRQAAVIRTALMTAAHREPAAHVAVLPR
ncbi:hypothetical protein AB0C59_14015 [Streptomyces sp. NPDC048664]|uniref:hypothetical protein n=1 Tax=Streptomyces sp. NPDC048664 TaxID=3154505 RepID=UPI00343D8A53